MNRWLAGALTAILAMCFFAGCVAAPQSVSSSHAEVLIGDAAAPATGATIAMVAGEADLESAFVQSTWTAISRFAGENSITCGLYRAADGSPDAAMATMELAERGGAELVVFVGESMGAAADRAQRRYRDVSFILLGVPAGTPTQDNGVVVRFSAEQGGWLAGYASVYERYKAVSYFDTGDEEAARYAMGFLLGADAAARDLSLEAGAITAYPVLPRGSESGEAGSATAANDESSQDMLDSSGQTASNSASLPGEAEQPEWEALAGLACEAGAEVLFANSRDLQDAALAAARSAHARTAGLAPEMPLTAEPVLAAVVFDPKNIVGDLLATWHAGRFPGGSEAIGTVADGGVSLATADARFNYFTQSKYDEIIDRFKLTSLPASIAVKLAPDGGGALPMPADLSLTYIVFADIYAVPAEPADMSAQAE